MIERSHPHPCNFRILRYLDRGWGEIAFEYEWDSSSTSVRDYGGLVPGLDHCSVYEFTTYRPGLGDEGDETEPGWFVAPDPPFAGWRFRDPTDGRFCHVGLESFSAAQGHGWDRHKLAGSLVLPKEPGRWTVTAIQWYRFRCSLCGCDADLDGPHAGPHSIVRSVTMQAAGREASRALCRYEIDKHGRTAWMEMDETGYIADSAHIGFGPAWLQPSHVLCENA